MIDPDQDPQEFKRSVSSHPGSRTAGRRTRASTTPSNPTAAQEKICRHGAFFFQSSDICFGSLILNKNNADMRPRCFGALFF